MNELFAEFQKLRGYLTELECKSYQIVMMVHLDGSGYIVDEHDDQLHYYQFGSSESTPVEWSNPQEGLKMLQDVLATLAIAPEAVVWY